MPREIVIKESVKCLFLMYILLHLSNLVIPVHNTSENCLRGLVTQSICTLYTSNMLSLSLPYTDFYLHYEYECISNKFAFLYICPKEKQSTIDKNKITYLLYFFLANIFFNLLDKYFISFIFFHYFYWCCLKK